MLDQLTLAMVSSFLRFVPYLLALAVLALALLSLRSDWLEHKNPRLRKAIVVAYICVSVLTLASLYLDSEEKREAGKSITELKSQVESANKAQKDNTELFIDSFKKFNNELSDLRTKVATEPLRQEISTLQGELQKTQKALTPGPKAVLIFSFKPIAFPADASMASVEVVKETKAPILADGSVHVEFTLLNPTDVDAVDGEVTIFICDRCKFAKEPEGFRRLPGQSDKRRTMPFDRIFAQIQMHTLSLDVIPPPTKGFAIEVAYRCRTCVIEKQNQQGIVYVVRTNASQK
jgi:hypothetical protein